MFCILYSWYFIRICRWGLNCLERNKNGSFQQIIPVPITSKGSFQILLTVVGEAHGHRENLSKIKLNLKFFNAKVVTVLRKLIILIQIFCVWNWNCKNSLIYNRLGRPWQRILVENWQFSIAQVTKFHEIFINAGCRLR